MKYVGFLLLALSLNFCVSAQVKGEDALKKLQQKFYSINDLSADFKQSASAGQNKGGFAGKYYYKKKDKFRIELKSVTIACDGKTTWNYSVKTKKYIVNDFAPEDPTNISLDRFVYDYPSKCKVTVKGKENVNGAGCSVIELVPHKTSMSFKLASLWVDDADLIRKIYFEDQNGTKVTVDLSNIKINQKVPDSKFKLTPPEGSKVIDLR